MIPGTPRNTLWRGERVETEGLHADIFSSSIYLAGHRTRWQGASPSICGRTMHWSCNKGDVWTVCCIQGLESTICIYQQS